MLISCDLDFIVGLILGLCVSVIIIIINSNKSK